MTTRPDHWYLPLILMAASCSGKGGPRPPADLDPTLPTNLTGTWTLAAEVLEFDGGTVAPDLSLDGDVELALHLDIEFDFYSATFAGIAPRPLPEQLTSIQLVHVPSVPERVFFGGLYYLPALDVTVELSGTLPTAEEFVTASEFVTLTSFDVFEGDAMVVENIEGVDEWVVADGSFLIGSGRVRVTGTLQ